MPKKKKERKLADGQPEDPRVFRVTVPQPTEPTPADIVDLALSEPLRCLSLFMMPWGGLTAPSFGGSLGTDEQGNPRGSLPPLAMLKQLREILGRANAILDGRPGGVERKLLREDARLLIQGLDAWAIEAWLMRSRVNSDGSFVEGELDPMDVPRHVVMNLVKLAEIGNRLRIGMYEDGLEASQNVTQSVQHGPSFEWLTACGTRYDFPNLRQRQIIQALFENAWSKGGDGASMSEQAILDAIEESAACLRLRVTDKFKGHAVLGTVLRPVGKGMWALFLSEAPQQPEISH